MTCSNQDLALVAALTVTVAGCSPPSTMGTDAARDSSVADASSDIAQGTDVHTTVDANASDVTTTDAATDGSTAPRSCATALGAPGASRRGLLFYDGMEDPSAPLGTDDPHTGWRTYDEHSFPPYSSMVRSNEHSRCGGYAARFELNRPSGSDANDGRSYRSEELWNATGPGQPILGIHWMAASVYLPAPYVLDPQPENVVFNVHDDNVDGGESWPNPMGIWTRNGHWELHLCADADNDGAINVNCREYDAGPYTEGAWADWVVNRNFSAGSDGYVRAWLNGRMVVDDTGPNWYADSFIWPEPYIKIGIYKWPWAGDLQPNDSTTAQRVIFVDEVRFGTDEAQLTDFLLD